MTEAEPNTVALADVRYAAWVNHIGRYRFRPLTAEAILSQRQPGGYDAILLDPPRAGLTPQALQETLRVRAPRLFYLSCDAPTLARDLQQLRHGGYDVIRLQAFDMFPQTAHLETLVELESASV